MKTQRRRSCHHLPEQNDEACDAISRAIFERLKQEQRAQMREKIRSSLTNVPSYTPLAYSREELLNAPPSDGKFSLA